MATKLVQYTGPSGGESMQPGTGVLNINSPAGIQGLWDFPMPTVPAGLCTEYTEPLGYYPC